MAARRPKGRSRAGLSTHGVIFDDAAWGSEVERFLDEVKDIAGQEGHDLVRQRFARSFKNPTGKYESRITVNRANENRVISDNFVIYGSWLEGTSTRNKSTKFKGYRAFRRTRLELRKRIVAIGQERLDRLIARLNA